MSELHYNDGTDDKNIFKDGHGLITNLTAKEFIEKCCDKSTKITLKGSLEWKKRAEGNIVTKRFSDKQKSNFMGKVEEAYMSVNALSEYCEKAATAFKHQDKKDGAKYFDKVYNRFEASSIFRLLDEKFNEIIDKEKAKYNMICLIYKIIKKDYSYSDFVTSNFLAFHNEYDEKEDKEVIRKMCFLVLGSSNNTDSNPVNKIDFMQNRKMGVSFVDAPDPNPVPAGYKRMTDVQYDTLADNDVWNAYVRSLCLDDNSGDASLLSNLGKGFMKKLDEKLLTLSPERDVWSSDGKGRILMSDSAETLSFNNTPTSGVTIKADGNPKLDKKHKDEAVIYLKRLLSDIGGE